MVNIVYQLPDRMDWSGHNVNQSLCFKRVPPATGRDLTNSMDMSSGFTKELVRCLATGHECLVSYFSLGCFSHTKTDIKLCSYRYCYQQYWPNLRVLVTVSDDLQAIIPIPTRNLRHRLLHSVSYFAQQKLFVQRRKLEN